MILGQPLHCGDPTKLTGAVGALHERDPGLAKLGGEPTRALALRAMRASAAALFAHPVEPSSWETRKLNQWQAHLGAEMRSSHIQLVATPIAIVYQVCLKLVASASFANT